MVNISSDESSMASDLSNSRFALNQLIWYTKGSIGELGNIIGINIEGKVARPLYTINIKGGKELHMEDRYLPHLS